MARILELTLSGLPLWWDAENLELLFGPEKKVLAPAVRRAAEMQDVLYRGDEPAAGDNSGTGGEAGMVGTSGTDVAPGKGVVPGAGDGPEFDGKSGWRPEKRAEEGEAGRALYFMYRALSLPEHQALFEKSGIRYDITVLVPGSIEAECIKTVGHYHPVKPGAACTYPEVYEVLHGQARYLLQRPCCLEEPREGLEQVIVISAAAGDKVLIPPDFGHVTINPGPDFLVMSNLVATDFESVYLPLQEMGGAGYFGLVSPTKERDDAHGGTGVSGSPGGLDVAGSAGIPGSSGRSGTVGSSGIPSSPGPAGSAGGLCNPEVVGGSGIPDSGPVFKPNPCYASLPPLIAASPQELPQFSLLKNIPQYSAFVENPAHFFFLTHPENYTADFQKYLQNILCSRM